MAILKCKMCGGDLNITADEKIIECEFCGTTQTIPDGSDEKKTNLFNRANRLRIANEFDKAAGIYESIIAEFPDEAESYWGLCLCKFGIEYVDDPKTAKKIPTCHRTSFESIFDDENYKMAIEKSDVIAQGVYKEEATVIDNLQKDILSIVHKEEPFDVFICYKETDELGQRTQDSVLAQDIYDALTDKGFKVFFSRITLEDKLGKQYEPYIFAALNSAKVMLAIGTKEEYYNAVWVKNEWSRFLSLMEKDKTKTLIPCYRDIDPYDMPQEFKNLQGQDMSKLGFLQDLVRGITKLIKPEQETVVVETMASVSAAGSADPLLKRAFLFLEDGNWQSADEYCEKVLDINPECAEAYIGKLMSTLRIKKRENLKNSALPFDNNDSYLKAIRFGDDKIKTELISAVKYIKERNEEQRKDEIYADACAKMRKSTLEDYKAAIMLFKTIPSHKDSSTLITECEKKAEELKISIAEAEKDSRYNKAVTFMKRNTKIDYRDARSIFASLKDWKDSPALLEECRKKLSELEARDLQRKKEEQEQAKIRNEKLKEYEKLFPNYKDKLKLTERIKNQTAKIKTLESRKTEGEKGSRSIKTFCGVCFGAGAFGALVGFGTNSGGLATFGTIYGVIMGSLLFLCYKSDHKKDKEIKEAKKALNDLNLKLDELNKIPSFESWCREEK